MTAIESSVLMVDYQVIDLSGDGRRVLLLEASGPWHVARIRGLAPGLGDHLVGRQAKLGAHLLLGGVRRTPICVDFEAVACTQDQALLLMHPTALPPDQSRDPAAVRGAPAQGKSHPAAG